MSATWTLKRPVHRGETARAAPLALYARVAEYLAVAVGADRGYSGVLSHNPMARPQGHDLRTTWGRCEPYDIKGELLAFVPKGWRKPRRPVTEIGRNCGLFSSLMAWAGSEANAGRDVLPVALDLNRGFDCPLDDVEVQGIARSVERYRARWIAQGRFYSEAEASEWGRRRGVKSGAARRKDVAERDAAIVDAYCAGEGTEREIAARFGLSKTAVHHILTRPDWLEPELGL